MTTARIRIAATDKTKKAFSSVNKRLAGMGKVLTSTQAKITALVSAAGIGALIAAQTQEIATTDRWAERMGVATETLGKLTYATGRYGVDAATTRDAIKDMSEKIADAAATGGSYDETLKRIGLNSKELVGLSMDEQFYRVSDAVSNLKTQGDKAFVSMELMSDGGYELLNAMQAGSGALREAGQEAVALGYAVNTVDASKVQAATESMRRAGMAIQGIGNRIAVQLSPYVEALTNSLVEASIEHNGFATQIVDGAEWIATAVAKMADIWSGLKLVWNSLATVFWGFVSGTLTGLEQVIDGINVLIDLVPGLEIKTTNAIAGIASAARDQLVETREALVDVWNQGSASDKVAAFFQKIRDESEETAQKVAQNRARITGGPSTGADAGGQDDAGGAGAGTDERIKERLQKLNESYYTEEQQLAASFARKWEIVQEAEIAQIGNQQQWDNLRLEAKREYQAKLEQLERDHKGRVHSMNVAAYQREARLDQTLWQAKTSAAASGLVELTKGAAQHSKKMFELNKNAAIADALINAPAAASGAYRFGAQIGGPVLGATFAAVALEAQRQQIKAISATSFSGGGGGTTPSAAGSTPTVNSQPLQAPQQQQQPQRVYVELAGNQDSQMSAREWREFMRDLQDEAGDAQLVF